MKIKVVVRGKHCDDDLYNNLIDEIEIEDIDLLRLAIKSVKGNYPDSIIDEDDCHVCGITEI